MPTSSTRTSENTNAKETNQSETYVPSTISCSQVSNASRTTTTTDPQPKPMSQISGVRRGLSHCDSVAADVAHLPKYGVKTDRETELGEVCKIIFMIERSHTNRTFNAIGTLFIYRKIC